MVKRPENERRQQGSYSSVDLHSVIFWVLSYMPAGMLLSLVLNSLAPLLIAVCLGYLTTQSLDA